jgi:hypothetical protein
MLHVTSVGPSQPEKHTLPKQVYQKVTNNKIITSNQPPYSKLEKKINYEIPNIF